MTNTWDHPCIEQRRLALTCPAENNDTARQPLVGGTMVDDWSSNFTTTIIPAYPVNPNAKRLVHCWVCNAKLEAEKDLDPRLSWVMFQISFGPNMMKGQMHEASVKHYSLYLADHGGERLPGLDPVMNVSKPEKYNNSDTCCEPKAYGNIRVYAELPENVTEGRLEVVPVVVNSKGEEFTMPAGLVTGLVKDWYDPAFVRASGAHALHQASAWGTLIFTAAFLSRSITSLS